MKKTIKCLPALLVAALLGAPSAWAGSANYYAAVRATAPSGCGLVYVSTDETPTDIAYTTEISQTNVTTVTWTMGGSDPGKAEVKFYLFAKANPGCRFDKWTATGGALSNADSTNECTLTVTSTNKVETTPTLAEATAIFTNGTATVTSDGDVRAKQSAVRLPTFSVSFEEDDVEPFTTADCRYSLDGSVWETADEIKSKLTDIGTYTIYGCYKYGNLSKIEYTPSAAAKLEIYKAIKPTITAVPTAGAITYGQTLDEATLSGGAAQTADGTPVAGAFAWKDTSTKPEVADSGTTSYTVVFTPIDLEAYDAVECVVTVTVNRKAVTVTAEDKSAKEGDPAPAYTVKYSGWATGEGESALTTKPTCTCAYEQGDEAGTYDIVPSGAVAANYSFDYVKGTLTVTPKTIAERVTVTGGTKSGDDNAPVYSFTSTSGTKTLVIPEGYKAVARILVVGGGGSGAVGKANTTSGGRTTSYYGRGGGGGQGSDTSNVPMPAGTYTITVGAGGAAKQYSGSSNYVNGNAGSPSSIAPEAGISGFATITGAAGAAGRSGATSSGPAYSGTSGFNKASDITGTRVTYGANGAGATTSTPSAGTNCGGGQGGYNKTTSGKGADGIVIVKITALEPLPKKPVLVEVSTTPVKRGDTLSTSTITLTMGDPNTLKPVPGTFDWKAPETVVTEQGEYPIVFTPTKTGYNEVDVMAQVSIIAPQEDDAEEVIDNGTSVTVKTTSFGSDWSATVVSGASYIETPELTVNDDDTATVTIKGKAIGTAVIDLYDGATWVKRITVAVMAPPKDGTVELTMDVDDADKTVQTTTTSSYWNNKIVSGADVVTATTAKNSGTGARAATTTIKPQAYGTAVIEVYSGSTTSGQGTLVQRIIVTVAPPTDGTQTITVAQNASKVVKTVNEIDSYKVTEGTASISSVTVGDREATIVASGTIGTAKVKLYNGDTLVKVVTVNVVDPTHTTLELSVSEIEKYVFPTGGATWNATASSTTYISVDGTTSGGQYTLKIGSKQAKNATSDQTATVTVTSNSVKVLTIDVTALKDNDWGDSQTTAAPEAKKVNVYIGTDEKREFALPTAQAVTCEELDPNGVITMTYNPALSTSFTPPDWMDPSTTKKTASTSSFTMTIKGDKVGTATLHVFYGGTNPARWMGNYDVTVYQPISKPGTTKSFTYDGTAKAPVASGTGYTVSGDATQTAAGAYVAIVTLDEYYCWPDHSTDPLIVEWTIAPAEITTATAANQTYTGSALTPELTVKAGELDATYDLGAWDPAGLTAVGTYTATVTGKGNFKGEKTVTFTIDPKAITVTACDTNMLVGCAAPEFKYEVTSGELVGTDELVGTLCTTDTLTVGTHDIVRANDWDNPNYDITFEKGTLTVRAGKVTVNGTGYDNVTDAFNDLLKNKGSATFNDTGIVYDGMTFQRGATLTVAADESWTVTNEGGTSLIATKIPGKMNLTVDGTLELSGDIYVAPAGEDDTVVTVTNFLLDASITVGKESNGATDAMAYLSFNNFYNEKQAEYRITLTTNGVVQSATKLDIAATFAAVEHFEVVEKEIPDGYVYTLEASEFYVKYYDGDEVVHSNKFTILNYMTDLHIWDGDRSGENLELVKYEKEKGGELEQTDEALRAYVKDEADDPGCDGEVKVLGTWKKTIATIKIVAEVGIVDVQTNGESVVGTLTLPAETTEIELELVKDDLTIPVYKVITNDVTNVTQRVATYAVVDGLTYTFIAEEAEDDPDATPVQKKQAIIDAIDEENKAVVGPKIDAVVDPSETPAEGKVSPDEMATWITENGIQSADMKESDYLVASVKLDAAAPITSEDSISVNNVSGTVEKAGMTVSIEVADTPVEEENTVVSATGIGTNGEVVAVSLDYDEETGRAQIAPEDPNVDSFVATLSVKSDDGSESIETKIGYLTKPAYTAESKSARELVAVPWASLSDGAAISVADFLVTDNLAEGTKLYSYDRANDRYNAWVLNASKVWEPINTIVIGTGGVVKPVENTPTAADAKIAYGEAVWVERADASTPLVFIGDAGEKNLRKTVTMEKGYNFVSFPNIKTALFRLNRIKNPGAKDFILVPQASGSPRQYTLKEGAWGYDRLYKPAGSKVTKKERVTDDTVDPGSGFEYVRDESTDEAPVVPLVEEETK